MEITQALVHGYAAAVAGALTAAGHQVTEPTVHPEEFTAELVIPDAWTEGDDRTGIALRWDWDAEPGWTAYHYNPDARTYLVPTDLHLGDVPPPEMVVRSVAAIVKAESLLAGQIMPTLAESLAMYAGEATA